MLRAIIIEKQGHRWKLIPRLERNFSTARREEEAHATYLSLTPLNHPLSAWGTLINLPQNVCAHLA